MDIAATMSEMTVDEVTSLPYVSLLARLGESNRPPGGIDTIRRLIVNCHIRDSDFILHAGCNAGFSSREIVHRTGCSAIGVDISADMARKADLIAKAQGLGDRLSYTQGDMRDLPFDDWRFDLTFSAGALAFVEGHEAALSEWIRVTRPHGLLADAELYYREEPPASVRSDVAGIIGVEVPNYDSAYWLDLFAGPALEPYYDHDAPVRTYDDARIADYVERFVAHKLPGGSPGVVEALKRRLVDTFRIFNANLAYMNYQIVVRRRLPDDAEPALYV